MSDPLVYTIPTLQFTQILTVFTFYLQHKLKQSQRTKVRQFVAITGTDEHTAISCLSQNEWRLDMATDNFYQDPVRYFVEPPKATVDRKKVDQLFNRYRSEFVSCVLCVFHWEYIV